MPKTALVTGASRGIGAACVRLLAAEGYRIAINYLHSETAALALAAETGGIPIRCDVADRAQVEAMFRSIGNVDVLICNAGIAAQNLFTDMTAEEWRRLFAVNVDGVYHCCQCALPGMIHKKAGSIVTVSSIWGLTGASCEVAYSASKAAVIGFTKALAKELGPSGIRINCVAPGVIDTEMNCTLTDDVREELSQETPLGRMGTAEEVASAVCFLASDKASFITGQVLSPNGGFII